MTTKQMEKIFNSREEAEQFIANAPQGNFMGDGRCTNWKIEEIEK